MKIFILNIIFALFIASLQARQIKIPIDKKTMKKLEQHFKSKKNRKQITLKQLKSMKNEIFELKDIIKNYRKESKQLKNKKQKNDIKGRKNSTRHQLKRRKKVHKKKQHRKNKKKHHQKHKKYQRKNVQLSQEDFEDKFQKVISSSLDLPNQQRVLFKKIYDEVGEKKIKELYQHVYELQPQARKLNIAEVPMNVAYMAIKLIQPFTFLLFLFSLYKYFVKKSQRKQAQDFLDYNISTVQSALTMKKSMQNELTDIKILSSMAYDQSEQIKVYKDSVTF